MAVPAVDAVVGDVVHVAELERLLDEDLLPGDVARSREDDGQYNQATNEGQKAENADFGKRVGASTEYLRHRRRSARPPLPWSLLLHGWRCGNNLQRVYHSCEKRIKEGQSLR
jgi:hypothetical protein